MTNKIKQSIAIQRQIPEHIRDNYPAFVEFIKVYYDFLQDTQSQNLEKIRDIDTTLDEFIERFKNELAKNVPIELAGDKRQLLKHIREFYLSRGSEASFKFLFRTLFNKDASLFYPSNQILRVSDGKWVQEVSIFVKVSGTTTDLSSISGKFVSINTGTKIFTTFVSTVTQYSNNTFEVFIENQFASNSTIVVGSTIELIEDGIAYTGVTLECPTKVSLYKSGKGFKVGQLFNLKTQLGQGCLIKITKVDTDGAIRAIQILRFGLDYKSTFYSYLSSKNLEAIEYVHPIHTGPYVPGQPAYNERSGGFIDYGFAAQQTYMYYDENIPVGSPDRRSDRYFGDPSYVGDIETQFFAEDIQNPIDEDLAIIKVELGAVAKYPGYYMSADGFISDEMYIQDGNYYQAFSYVIKVEEELRKYADIVRALIHPAGIKMFAEYDIYNELKLSAVNTILSNKLQLPLETNAPSSVVSTDGGFAYNNYTAVIVNGQITYVPAVGASKVFKQNRPSLFATKKVNSNVVSSSTNISKSYAKNIKNSITELDLISKHVLKPIADAIQTNLDTIIKGYSKRINDTNNTSTFTYFDYSKALFDNAVSSVNVNKDYSKNVISEINVDNDFAEKQFDSLKEEIVLNTILVEKLLEKTIIDSNNAESYYELNVFKNLEELIDSPIDEYDIHYFKNIQSSIEECISFVEKAYDKPLVDIIQVSQTAFVNDVLKSIDNIITVLDDSNLEYNKNISSEVETSNDFVEKQFDSLKEEIVLNTILVEKLLEKIILDTNSMSSSNELNPIKNLEELINSPSDEYNIKYFKNIQSSIEECISFVEKAYDKQLSDVISVSETTFVNDVLKSIDNIITVLDYSNLEYIKNISEEQIVLHYVQKDIESLKTEAIELIQQYDYLFEKGIIEEDVSHLETQFNEAIKNIYEIIENLEESFYSFEKNISEIASIDESTNKDFEKLTSEELSLTDNNLNVYDKNVEEELSILDTLLITRLILFQLYIDTMENYSNAYHKFINDIVDNITDDDTSSFDKTIEEPINTYMIGKLRDNPYDSGDPNGYFDFDEDYQPVTTLS